MWGLWARAAWDWVYNSSLCPACHGSWAHKHVRLLGWERNWMCLSTEKNRGGKKGPLDITFQCADRAALLRPLNVLMPLFWSWLGRSPLCTRDCGNCTLLWREKGPDSPFCLRNEKSSHTVEKMCDIFNSPFCYSCLHWRDVKAFPAALNTCP